MTTCDRNESRFYKSVSRTTLLITSSALSLSLAGQAIAQDALEDELSQATQVGEIVVTANRTAQVLSRVPMSVEAFTEERLERENVRDFADLAEATPGLRYSQSSLGSSSISIRGIASGSGAATTGIYINDMPIQVRGMGNSAAGFTPSIFDLQRVEVLRGPQGTLFGDSSMGGAVRFITPEADLHSYGGYTRGEVSSTAGGGMSYEGGLAVGGPIIEGVLGFRASAYYRHAAGWIDRMAGEVALLSPDGSAGPLESLDFQESGLYAEDTNFTDTAAFRVALEWRPLENLRIKPSVHYEQRDSNDIPNFFWPALSDPEQSRFVRPIWLPRVDADHTPLPADVPRLEPGKDRFVFPSLNVEWDLGPVNIVSTTSYFDREQESISDYTTIYVRLFSSSPVPRPGDYTYVEFDNSQSIFTQELRFQSPDPDARLRWVGGLFYSANQQISEQETRPNFVMANVPAAGVDGGAPFGPGYSAYMNYYGMEPPDSVTYYHLLETNTDQIAAFGQVDYKVTERLTLTAGIRYSRVDLGFDSLYAGSNNNQNQPRGLACVPGTGRSGVPCDPVNVGEYAPGEGPFEIVFPTTSDSGVEEPLTPKVGVSFQYDPDNLFYATVAKGYRIGGAQARLPGTCQDELLLLGYPNGQSPEVYESDTVTSYEIGSKNRLLGGRLTIDASAYWIEWEGIQTNTPVSSCGVSFIRNGTGATSRGIDLGVNYRATDDLTLGLLLGYQDAFRNETEILNGRVLSTEGAPIGGRPLQLNLNAEQRFFLPTGTEGYARLDYQYTSKAHKPDTGAANYDALIPRGDATHNFNGRIGVYVNDVNVYVFGTNLLNDNNYTIGRSINTPIWSGSAPRPRTLGFGASYRF